jgi:Phage P22-like portal protein
MAGQYKYPTPSKKLSKEQQQAVLQRVRERIEEAWTFERDNRREAATDLRFVAGDQWPDAVKKVRAGNSAQGIAPRPMLVINQLPQFVNQVTNPIREAEIGIKAVPVDDQGDTEVAKIYNGIIRDIEFRSNAKAVYVNGNEHQAKCGIGHWQICRDYGSGDTFEQELRIERIENPLAVYYDTAAVMPDRSDGMWAAIVEQWPRSRLKRQYPNAVPQGVDVPGHDRGVGFNWVSIDSVAVACYFEKEEVYKTIAQTADGQILDITKWPKEMVAQAQFVQVRQVEGCKVIKYLCTGTDILEGPIEEPGQYIPIVPVIGAETPTEVGQYRFGVVRFARDPQQLKNYYRTATAEAIALAPKSPYLVTPKMIGPHQHEWDTLNQNNRTYLSYEPDPLAPNGPKREHPPEMPQAMVVESQNADLDLMKVTGLYEGNLGQSGNEVSGVALDRRQARGNMANSHYSDNLIHSLTYTGKILIDLIPHVYDSERAIKLRDENGKETTVTINKTLYALDGEPIVINDLSKGRYDVRVTVSKSYITKRIEAMGAMLEFAKGLPPQAQMVFLDLIAKNSDWPDAEQLSKRLRNLVPPEALADPDDPNAPPPPQPTDDPLYVAQLEELEGKIKKLHAEYEKISAEAKKALVEADMMDASSGSIVMPSVIDAGNDNPAPKQGKGTSVPSVKPEQAPAPPQGFQGRAL